MKTMMMLVLGLVSMSAQAGGPTAPTLSAYVIYSHPDAVSSGTKAQITSIALHKRWLFVYTQFEPTSPFVIPYLTEEGAAQDYDAVYESGMNLDLSDCMKKNGIVQIDELSDGCLRKHYSLKLECKEWDRVPWWSADLKRFETRDIVKSPLRTDQLWCPTVMNRL